MSTKSTKPVKSESNLLKTDINSKITVGSVTNADIMETGLKVMNLPTLDIVNCSTEELQDRINEFFMLYGQKEIKPPLNGLAVAINIDRRRIHEIANGDTSNATYLTKSKVDLVKKAYNMLTMLWENYMLAGKINPVSGIFLGKNHWGYSDKSEVVVTPNTAQEDYNAADIAAKYALPKEQD